MNEGNLNEHWQDRWEDLVSVDQDNDSEFLFKLIVRKLGFMINYFSKVYEELDPNRIDYNQDRVDISKMIRSMKNCYELGNKILNFNYGEAADKIYEEKGDPSWIVESSEEEDYLEWDRLCRESVEARRKDIEKLFRNMGRNIDTWWL